MFSKTKKFLKKCRSESHAVIDNATGKVVAFGGGLVAMGAGSANAAIDPSVQTGLTALAADGVSLAGMVTPVVIGIVLAILGIRLVKKFLGKAV